MSKAEREGGGLARSPAGFRAPRAGSPPQPVHSSSEPSHTMHQDRAPRRVLCRALSWGTSGDACAAPKPRPGCAGSDQREGRRSTIRQLRGYLWRLRRGAHAYKGPPRDWPRSRNQRRLVERHDHVASSPPGAGVPEPPLSVSGPLSPDVCDGNRCSPGPSVPVLTACGHLGGHPAHLSAVARCGHVAPGAQPPDSSRVSLTSR